MLNGNAHVTIEQQGHIMSRTKNGVEQVIGKTISGVVLTENLKTDPRSQLFLIFSDRTSFEFWVDSDRITTASCVDQSDMSAVTKITRNRPHTKIWEFPTNGAERTHTQSRLWDDDK